MASIARSKPQRSGKLQAGVSCDFWITVKDFYSPFAKRKSPSLTLSTIKSCCLLSSRYGSQSDPALPVTNHAAIRFLHLRLQEFLASEYLWSMGDWQALRCVSGAGYRGEAADDARYKGLLASNVQGAVSLLVTNGK